MIVAVDIGGTKVAAGRVEDGAIIERRGAASPLHDDYARLPALVEQLTADWMPDCTGFGIATAGLVEATRVRLMSRRGQPSIALADDVAQRCGVRPVVLNDAWAGALGEFTHGDFGSLETLLYVTVSTGIGAGIVHKGQLLTSANGLMAHLGHATVPSWNGPPQPCVCGRVNCVEAVASGTAIAARASALAGQELSARDAFALADRQPAIAAMLDNAAHSFAEAVLNARAMLGVDMVVLGGGVGLVPAFHDRVAAVISAQRDPWPVEIRPARLGADAELLGAAEAARRHVTPYPKESEAIR